MECVDTLQLVSRTYLRADNEPPRAHKELDFLGFVVVYNSH